MEEFIYIHIKPQKRPLQVKQLESFENNLVDMAQNIKFRKVINPFQTQMYEDVKMINSSKAFISANKTRNLYKLDKKAHYKILQVQQ